MLNTTFSIELQGLNLPEDIKDKLQSELRSVVLSEIARTDLGKEVSVRPLPGNSERVFSHASPILGFIIEKLGQLTQRSTGELEPSPPFTSPDQFSAALRSLGSATTPPLDGAPLTDVLDALYYRPDIRSAVISNSRAFAELLSRDEQATKAFNELTGIANLATGTERFIPVPMIVLIVVLAAANGLVWGAASRPQ